MSTPHLPLSVVVSTRDRPEFLEACLGLLTRSVEPMDEVIVIDSASVTAETGLVAERHAVRLARAQLPGLARARNLGWRLASHDLVAFVDDDVRVTPGWAAAMRAAFAGHPEAAFVTGRVEVPPEQVGTERPVAIKEDLTAHPLSEATAGVLGHGANMGVRRDALERVDGFDELLGAGGRLRSAEDLDAFDRLFAAGFRGWYEPSALAFHVQWRDRRQLLALDWRDGIGAGARIAKLVRSDRTRAQRAARQLFWDGGLRCVAKDVRQGYEFGVATTMVRMAGALVGGARGAALRVRDGHYAARGAHR